MCVLVCKSVSECFEQVLRKYIRTNKAPEGPLPLWSGYKCVNVCKNVSECFEENVMNLLQPVGSQCGHCHCGEGTCV